MTLTLALPIWLGRIVWSVGYQANRLLAHLVPSGTPGPLIPVIVIIETVKCNSTWYAICAIRGKHNGRTPTFNSVRLAGPGMYTYSSSWPYTCINLTLTTRARSSMYPSICIYDP